MIYILNTMMNMEVLQHLNAIEWLPAISWYEKSYAKGMQRIRGDLHKVCREDHIDILRENCSVFLYLIKSSARGCRVGVSNGQTCSATGSFCCTLWFCLFPWFSQHPWQRCGLLVWSVCVQLAVTARVIWIILRTDMYYRAHWMLCSVSVSALSLR